MNILCSVLLFCLLASSGLAGLLNDSKLAAINSGMEYLMNSHWDSAAYSFEQISEIDSTDPGFYLFSGLTMLSEMTDHEENIYGETFEDILDSVKLKANDYLDSCTARDSAMCYLYMGHAHAYKSLYYARFKSSYSALREGLKAKGDYQKGLKADSTLYDLHLGLGSYHYWKTVKAGLLRTFGIFANERNKGIEEIKLAADSALFSKAAAKSSLIWVMLNEKKYDSSLMLASQMYFKYPNSNSFVWPIAKAFYKQGNFEKSAEYYRKLFERFKNNPGNYYNLLESSYWLFKSYYKLDNKGQAFIIREFADSVYNISPKSTKKKQRKHIWDMNNHRW